MGKYYIGNRLNHSEMAVALGVDRVSFLNRGMSNVLASVAMKKGIKKSQKGKGITFWAVDQEQMEFLTAESSQTFIALKTGEHWNPLLVVDADLMSKKIDEVNTKYGRRFAANLQGQYNQDLQNAVEESVQKLNEDVKTKIVREEKKGNINGVKVGDYLRFGYKYPHFGVVTRVTKSSYWFAELEFKVGHVTNVEYAKAHFNNVTETTRGDYGDMGWKIPFAGNEEHFEYKQSYQTMKRFDGHECVVDCYEKKPSICD